LLRAPEVMRADVLGILDGLEAPAVVVGHSLGGYLALRAALDRPDAVRALVLEDPAQPVAGRTPYAAFADETDAFVGVMTDPETRAVKVAEMQTASTWTDAEIAEWARCKPLVDREYVRRGSYLDDGEWESHFAALSVPTLLVSPPDTPMAPDLSLVNNPLVRSVVIPRSGHCVRRDQPARYHQAVEEFLAQVPLD
jgi:pimeloyl-ACP methyl ester carboxylesterase